MPLSRAASPLIQAGNSGKRSIRRQAALAGLLKDGMLVMAAASGCAAFGEPDPGDPRVRMKNLTVVSNNAGIDGVGSAAARHPADQEDDLVLCRENKTFAQQYLAGELEIEFNPQGTLAEHPRRRHRIPAFFTAPAPARRSPRARRSAVQRRTLRDGARSRRRPLHRARLEGRHRRQPRLSEDRAQLQSDDGHRRQGHRRRVENLVEPGQINPDHIITPGVFVKRIVHVPNAKRIEQRTVRKRA